MAINSVLKASLIDGAIRESVSGLVSEYRAHFRTIKGLEGRTQQVTVSLEDLQERVQSRLDGLRPDINVGTLTLRQLSKGLAEIGIRAGSKFVLFEITVPVPRSAHAR